MAICYKQFKLLTIWIVVEVLILLLIIAGFGVTISLWTTKPFHERYVQYEEIMEMECNKTQAEFEKTNVGKGCDFDKDIKPDLFSENQLKDYSIGLIVVSSYLLVLTVISLVCGCGACSKSDSSKTPYQE